MSFTSQLPDQASPGPADLGQLASDNPQLADQAPGSFMAAANSAAPDLAIPAVAQSLQLQSAQQAVSQHAANNNSGGFWGGLLNFGGGLLNLLNKPLLSNRFNTERRTISRLAASSTQSFWV